LSWFHSRRPSAALVVSVIALIAALSGTAYAGIVLGHNSVGTKQLRNRAVTTAKIHNGAITAVKLKKGLLVPLAARADVANAAGTALTAGHASSADSATAAASSAALTGVNVIVSAAFTNPHGQETFGEADCPAGQYAVGGGAWNNAVKVGESINSSWPTRQNATDVAPDAWGVWMNNSGSTDSIFSVYAICASGRVASSYEGFHAVRGR
jgi:hypothetical protein